MYDVEVIDESALPAGQDWAVVDRGGHVTLYVKEDACGPRVIAEAWAAYRMLDRHRTPCRERLLRLA